MHSVPQARADPVANQAELAWLTKYPLSNEITVEIGKWLFAGFTTVMTNDYRILYNSIGVRNP